MEGSYHLILVFMLLALPTIQGFKYTVINDAAETKGGVIFSKIMGEEGAKSSMEASTYFICNVIFEQHKKEDRREVDEVKLIIQKTMNDPFWYRRNLNTHEIHLRASDFEKLDPNGFVFENKDCPTFPSIAQIVDIENRVKFDINWKLTFGITLVVQWTGNNDIPMVLRKGIAAFAVLKSQNHRHKPDDWAAAGKGNKWDESFDVVGQFFYYVSGIKSNFVAELNKKMKTSYSDSYFEEAAGMSIKQYWKQYKTHKHEA